MLLTIREVAERLKVCESCAYSLVARGKLRHLRIGIGRGTIRVREEDLERYLEQCVHEEGAEPQGPAAQRQKLKHLRYKSAPR